MNTHALSLAGIVMYSPDPDRLVGFYREHLGVPFELADHGTVDRPGLTGLTPWQG